MRIRDRSIRENSENLPRSKSFCVDDLRSKENCHPSKSTTYQFQLLETAKLRLRNRTGRSRTSPGFLELLPPGKQPLMPFPRRRQLVSRISRQRLTVPLSKSKSDHHDNF